MEWTMTANVPGQVCLMQGNEAITRGAVEAGIHFAASYPGSPSSQVLGMLGKIAKERGFYAQWSTNEVCALESCMGASLAGAILYILLYKRLPEIPAILFSVALVITIRLLAAHFRWNLPRIHLDS